MSDIGEEKGLGEGRDRKEGIGGGRSGRRDRDRGKKDRDMRIHIALNRILGIDTLLNKHSKLQISNSHH